MFGVDSATVVVSGTVVVVGTSVVVGTRAFVGTVVVVVVVVVGTVVVVVGTVVVVIATGGQNSSSFGSGPIQSGSSTTSSPLAIRSHKSLSVHSPGVNVSIGAPAENVAGAHSGQLGEAVWNVCEGSSYVTEPSLLEVPSVL